MSKGSPQIAFRLPTELRERVKAAAKEAGTDTSAVVLQALKEHLGSPNGDNGAGKRPLAPPEQIAPLIQEYRSLVDRDRRDERNRLYKELLAASFVVHQYYEHAPGVHEAYFELRWLAKLFGIKEGV